MPSLRQPSTRFGMSVAVALSSLTLLTPYTAAAAELPPPPKPVLPAPAVLDPHAAYVPQRSCDPQVQPGVKAFADMLRLTYGWRQIGVVRACAVGGSSEHKEGRALDWHLNAFNTTDAAVAASLTQWLTVNDAENARRTGVMYMIWNKKIWSAERAAEGWRPYFGASAHTDHVHISFSWAGAKKATSWWTGQTSVQDYGPCRVYAGQPAPVRTARNVQPCATDLPAAPIVTKPMYWFGSAGADVRLAQRMLGIYADGFFGGATRNAVLRYQATKGLPRTGALDAPTWAKLVPSTVVPPPPAPPAEPVQTAPGVTAPVAPAPVAPAPVVTKPAPTPAPRAKPAPRPKPKASPLARHKGKLLRKGSRGEAVRAAQAVLRLSPRFRTGFYGPVTEAAVRRFQALNRLPRTGRIDARTWAALERTLIARRR